MAKKLKIRKFRVAVTMAVIAGAIIAVDSFRRDIFHTPTNSSVTVDGQFSNKRANDENFDGEIEIIAHENVKNGEIETQALTETDIEYLGSSEKSIPAENIGRGPFAVSSGNGEILPPESKNLIFAENFTSSLYRCADMNLSLNQETYEAFNQMMNDYNLETSAYDISVYGTFASNTFDSPCPVYYDENIGGYNVDIAVDSKNGTIQFDGEGNSSWILKNCTKYGFIVRYPKNKQESTGHEFCKWHLRYVGVPHAELMFEKKLSLEEYIEFVKDYDFDSPFVYQTNNGIYKIYFTEQQDGITPVRVPINGNYSISGNNSDGFIVTIKSLT